MDAETAALEIMNAAIKSADPYRAVRRSISVDGNRLMVFGKELPVRGKIYLLAFGKAACSMARAVVDLLGERIEEGVIVTKHGYAGNCPKLGRLRVIEAGHPVPDGNSLLGGRLGLELAEKVGEDDVLLVLISGGGSALFLLPERGITLEDKIRTNELLLESGAKIYEINTVRKHISAVKGGKLAKRVKGTVISLILSDVVGDPLEAIASGPTVKDPTTFQDAFRILKLYGVWEKLPESVKRHIELGLEGKAEETLKEDLPNVHNFIVGGNTLACESALEKAEELGYNAAILTTTLEGEAREVALAIGSIVQEVARYDRPVPKPAVLIAGGEWTVTIGEKAGLGGPNQEFALSIARKIEGLNAVVLAVDTDGTDGPTDAAGGIVDGKTLGLLREAGIDVEEVLRGHDAYNALEKAGALLKTGPTGTNVNSLVIAVIPSPATPSGNTKS
ncbi:glycerate kinase type-2 family protein [Thermococcus thioreducens]|uniref:Glycerate 2-kinase n=1 Tax=Thermococcus thioreducens TaxID=277988 RepID=A0A0Q2M4U8_9EURY|nr:glycerate kinase [Thermococcus thioreducens]ASJ13558.1 glycerate kinase [Thermococcus thioreducens]KQH82938.1 glycerate kinase [Thermococcus thioreducens]SEV82143.1 glycerate 2-kinase [Thermococcus thioreducens]